MIPIIIFRRVNVYNRERRGEEIIITRTIHDFKVIGGCVPRGIA